MARQSGMAGQPGMKLTPAQPGERRPQRRCRRHWRRKRRECAAPAGAAPPFPAPPPPPRRRPGPCPRTIPAIVPRDGACRYRNGFPRKVASQLAEGSRADPRRGLLQNRWSAVCGPACGRANGRFPDPRYPDRCIRPDLVHASPPAVNAAPDRSMPEPRQPASEAHGGTPHAGLTSTPLAPHRRGRHPRRMARGCMFAGSRAVEAGSRPSEHDARFGKCTPTVAPPSAAFRRIVSVSASRQPGLSMPGLSVMESASFPRGSGTGSIRSVCPNATGRGIIAPAVHVAASAAPGRRGRPFRLRRR